jgi:MoaA/NifB/PqqE/SkfB family radical SAM enzyme
MIMCELNPLQIVFISHDGCVSPCVYLNMTKRGTIQKIFRGKHYETRRVCFGNAFEKDFLEIWNIDDYGNFRKYYHDRVAVAEKNRADFSFGLSDVAYIEKNIRAGLMAKTLPGACKECYKAYGI